MKTRAFRQLFRLGEKVGSLRTPGAALTLLRQYLPELMGISGVDIYVLDSVTGALLPVRGEAEGASRVTGAPEKRGGFHLQAARLCFVNRTLVDVPDASRSPFQDSREGMPRSALFMPMFAQEDVAGVLEVYSDKAIRYFSDDEKAVLQHTANQIAMGMRLLEQKSLRERAAGVERFELMNQVLALTVRQLKQPLGNLRTLLGGSADQQHLCETAEVDRAEAILGRLCRLTGDREEDRVVDLDSIVRAVMSARAPVWKETGLRVKESLPAGGIPVDAATSGYLEVVISGLFQHAEDMLQGRNERSLDVRLSAAAGVARLEIVFAGVPSCGGSDLLEQEGACAGDLLDLRLCRSLVRSLGGDLRLTKKPEGGLSFELELSTPQTARPELNLAGQALRHAENPLTVLIVQPDPQARQNLMALLGEAGHRSIAASSVDEALEMLKQLRFDAMLCSARLPGQSWSDCYERSRGRVGAFVLLTRGHDRALDGILPPGGGYTLPEPVQPGELGTLLVELETRANDAGRYNEV
jgi:CheY-like chemotaxis protein